MRSARRTPGRTRAWNSRKPGHDNFHQTVVNDTAGSLKLSSRPCAIKGAVFTRRRAGRGCGRRGRSPPGMPQTRGGWDEGVDVGDAECGERAATGQRRAVEQQAAITTLFPQGVVRGLRRTVFGSRLCAVRGVIHTRHGHVHAHRHGTRGVLIHRHRLRNQRADEDHQHGEQGDPATAGQSLSLAMLAGRPGALRAHGRGQPDRLLGVIVCLGFRRFLLHRDFDGNVAGLLEMQGQRKRLPSLSRLRSFGLSSIT